MHICMYTYRCLRLSAITRYTLQIILMYITNMYIHKHSIISEARGALQTFVHTPRRFRVDRSRLEPKPVGGHRPRDHHCLLRDCMCCLCQQRIRHELAQPLGAFSVQSLGMDMNFPCLHICMNNVNDRFSCLQMFEFKKSG